MDNSKESPQYWLRDASASFEAAKRNFELNDWRVTTHFAQVAIEESAKAVIVCFTQPEWTHDPGKQLREVINENKDIIKQKIDEQVVLNLMTVAKDAEKYASWHGKSIYGLPKEHIPAVDLCTKEVAEDILNKAEMAITTAKNFIQRWF